MKLYFYTLILLASVALYSCAPDEPLKPVKPPFSSVYVGKISTYAVEEIHHDAFTRTTDTLNYRLRETVEELYIDAAGDTAYKVRIDRSEIPENTWVFDQYAIEQKDVYGLERIENDSRKVKLIYPVSDGKRWDVNLFNAEDPQYGYYQDVDQPYPTSDSMYPETVNVILANQTNFIFSHIETEIYARNTRLIKKEIIQTETQPGKYKNGIEYTKIRIK